MSNRTVAVVANAEASPVFPWITGISVDQLFGRYTYRLVPEEGLEGGRAGRLLILYGDNGSGKTTLLQLLFHILSTSRDRGHKGFIARIPFKSFSVTLANGTEIVASRRNGKLTGDFELLIRLRRRTVEKARFALGPDDRIAMEEEANRAADSLVEHMEQMLGQAVYFLSDKRSVESDRIPTEESEEVIYTTSGRVSYRRDRLPARPPGSELKEAISRAVDWVRRQAITGSNVGSVNVNAIYADVINRIVKSPAAEPEQASVSIERLIQRLNEIAERNLGFSRFGLTSSLDVGPLVGMLMAAPPATHPVIFSVMDPYLEGIQARLNALQGLQNVLVTFVRTTNTFLRDKQLDFGMAKGFSVKADDQELDPDSLSSGEKQLLLLLSHTLHAREQNTVFIIDEPELSLNVKWQRKLIDALLACTDGAGVQFVFATHSIEFLSQHMERVVRLTAPE